jgi:hypothetical protein
MTEKLENIIRYIIWDENGDISLSGVNVPEQLRPSEHDDPSIARNLNAAFLIALSGESNPLFSKALHYLETLQDDPCWGKTVHFYKEGLELIRSEISERCSGDSKFKNDLDLLYSWIIEPEKRKNRKETFEKMWQVFFPEGVAMFECIDEKIDSLREERGVSISQLNPSPVKDPKNEILFTSNILVTVPPSSVDIDTLPLSPSLIKMLKGMIDESQIYWYDHPVQVGTAPENNEVLYGLEGLDKAVEFEKERGTTGKNGKLTCLLSVSVTHRGLQNIVKLYLEEELKKEKNINNLDVYVFTEADTTLLVKEILVPAAQQYGLSEEDLLYEIVGVDGEYGRHYSFLKAIAAFWQVMVDTKVKGTFKIDLDQVFPQKELVEQTGASAFEHLRTPLWGAKGTDNQGKSIELGMIAGALVNQKDIRKSLFTPDVPFPSGEIKVDNLIFFSTLPQALSTEAEMMTRYGDGLLDGKTRCIQRIHVTGGTNGILIDSLRRHRPFTPTFIGRAEDQAYILSVLLKGPGQYLRYVHKDGMIMRHDKEVFAAEAVKAASIGKLIGDYIRILLFSCYINILPWPFEDIKDTIDPFTGCFASRIPLTVVYLCFALKAASIFAENGGEKSQHGYEFSKTGSKRLHETILKLTREPCPLIEQYLKEKEGWRIFYEILGTIESNLKKGDTFALELQRRAVLLAKNCRINFGKEL